MSQKGNSSSCKTYIVLAIEVGITLQSVVAVERNDELDPIATCVVHKVIKAVKDFIVVFLWGVSLKRRVAGERSPFLGRVLACVCIRRLAVERSGIDHKVQKQRTVKPDSKHLNTSVLKASEQGSLFTCSQSGSIV